MRSASGKTLEGSITNCMTPPFGAGSANVVPVRALACAPLTSDLMPARSRSTTRSFSELLAYLLCETIVPIDAPSTSFHGTCADTETDAAANSNTRERPKNLYLFSTIVTFSSGGYERPNTSQTQTPHTSADTYHDNQIYGFLNATVSESHLHYLPCESSHALVNQSQRLEMSRIRLDWVDRSTNGASSQGEAAREKRLNRTPAHHGSSVALWPLIYRPTPITDFAIRRQPYEN